MDEEASHPSHAMHWTAGVLTALLLYVLSIGPVEGLCERGTIPVSALPWLTTFYQPVTWLHNNTLLQQPLDAYYDWWRDILGTP